MGDMPTDFWAGWIAVLTITSFVGLGWLIYSIYFSDVGEAHAGEEPVWDENLREGNNPAPMWWFWLILSLMVFSVIYLMLYPGLGSYAGALKWTQGGRLQASLSDYEQEFGGTRKLIAEARLETLSTDTRMVASAQHIYDQNCAACHGYESQGQAGLFPSLADDDWQWGGSPQQIEATIRQGRTAAMVPWKTLLGEAGVVQMSELVQQLAAGDFADHPSYQKYLQFCSACHGADGAGNTVFGAPRLNDDIWLYGGDQESVEYTLNHGRNGEMPAFGGRLDDTQIRLLVMLLTKDQPHN